VSQYRILLVDDQPIVVSAIAHYLNQRGYEVHIAGDGKEGLLKAEEVRPDLVITDVTMPNMDGWSLVKALRAMPLFTLLPVIILTDQDSPESRMEGFRLGADDFVSKTTLVEELEVRIARALERGAVISRAMRVQSVKGGLQSGAQEISPAPSPRPESIEKQEPTEPAEAEPIEEDVGANDRAMLELPPLADVMKKGYESAPSKPSDRATAEQGSKGLQGSLDEIGLASVLTLVCMGEQTGVLKLRAQLTQQSARILIRTGRILKIGVENEAELSPVQAIANIMGWKGATFSFSPLDVTSRDEVKATTEHLLMHASQILDEGLN